MPIRRSWRGILLLAFLNLLSRSTTSDSRGGDQPQSATSPRVNEERTDSRLLVSKPETLAHLKGVEIDGEVFRLGQSRGCQAIAVIFLSTDCPISNGYIPELNSLFQAFHVRGVEFYGVISAPDVSRSVAAKHQNDFKILFPVLFDASSLIRRELKATHTPEAFVLTRESKVLYRGLIDDRYSALGQKRSTADLKLHFLKAALQDVLGNPIQVPSTTPIGCPLEDDSDQSSSGNLTYFRDIAPIIQANCVSCHRAGQTAPFALETYEDVTRHAKPICEATHSKRMPPWKAVRNFGHFHDERGLTPQEIELLKRWTETGKTQGDPKNRPEAQALPEGWQLGKPDLILRMDQAFEVSADGDDVHQCFVLPTFLRENRLISAIEFLPGNPKVVHHAAFYMDATRTARRLDAGDPNVGYRSFGSPGFLPTTTFRNWLPGYTPRHLPKGMGRWIPQGSDLVLEIHYRPSGKLEKDRSVVGIHFAPRSTKQFVSEFMVFNLDLEIPAGERRHHHSASFTLPANITLLDAAPHMHLLGREMKVIAHFPDGHEEPLVWIRDWDFNWQEQYTYAHKLQLPKGAKIVVDCYFDNSQGNPLNPNSPPRNVFWGPQTKDCMALCQFQFTCDSLADLSAVNREYARFLLEQSAAKRFAGSSDDSQNR